MYSLKERTKLLTLLSIRYHGVDFDAGTHFNIFGLDTTKPQQQSQAATLYSDISESNDAPLVQRFMDKILIDNLGNFLLQGDHIFNSDSMIMDKLLAPIYMQFWEITRIYLLVRIAGFACDAFSVAK